MPSKSPSSRLHPLSSNQFIVVMVMVAVVVWVLGVLISQAVFKTISFNNRLLEKKQEIDRTLGANIKAVDSLKAAYQELETLGPSPKIVNQALPDTADLPAVVSRFEALIHASGLEFSSFALRSTQLVSSQPQVVSRGISSVATTPQELMYSIGAEGTYPGILKMLRNLENEITPTRLTEVKIHGTQQQASAVLVIKGYYQEQMTTNPIKETYQ